MPIMTGSLVVGFLIDSVSSQAKNPGLNISLRNQPDNLLAISSLWQSTVCQGLTELRQSSLNSMTIGVDYYDQSSSRFGMPNAVRLYLRRIRCEDPLFGAALARWRGLGPNLMRDKPRLRRYR
jgi:hypothetical protein